MKPLNRTPFGASLLSLVPLVSALLLAFGIRVYPQPVQPSTPQSQWDDLADPQVQEQLPRLGDSCWWQQIRLDLAPEYFYWQEKLNGHKLLDENGFRIGLEAAYVPPQEMGWIWASRIKVYGGAVAYDGSTFNLQTGATTPLKSTTDYYGVIGEAGYGYRWDVAGDYQLDVLGRLSLDFWLRHLGSAYGYNEYWFPISLKAGVEISPKNIGWIGALGLKVPVYTYQTVDLARLGGGTVVLHPKTMVSPYAEVGYKFTDHASISAFFDGYWFRQSSVHDGFLQPESKSYEVGAKLGWTF
jgi:hypothetical protein